MEAEATDARKGGRGERYREYGMDPRERLVPAHVSPGGELGIIAMLLS